MGIQDNRPKPTFPPSHIPLSDIEATHLYFSFVCGIYKSVIYCIRGNDRI